MSTINDVIKTDTVTSANTTDLDAANLQGAGPTGENIFRERVQIAGQLLAQIAAVFNQNPNPTDYGVVVRPVGGTEVIDRLDKILLCLLRMETHLASMSDEEITNKDINPEGI